MRQIVPFLLFASRSLAICAVLAGLGLGLVAALSAGFTCFDTCPTREDFFSHLGPRTVQLMAPCLVLEALAVAAFLAYCLATRQARRAVISILFLLVGGLVGVAALSALLRHGQATLPVWGGEEGDLLRETPAVTWAQQWGLALTLVAGAWSGVLAYLQWGDRRPPTSNR